MITFFGEKIIYFVFYQKTRLNHCSALKNNKIFPLVLFLVLFVACKKTTMKTEGFPHSSETKEQSEIKINLLKNAYFGETHMHTQYSLDAYIGGNLLAN